jgi:hypothetical protein
MPRRKSQRRVTAASTARSKPTSERGAGPPTEKEVEDYREEKLAEDRKQWDADLGGNSESDAAIDRLRELRAEATKLKNG